MLPFLQNSKKDATTAGESREVLMRDEMDTEFLDVIVDDLMDAFHNRDKHLLKLALEALMEHMKQEDEIQDSLEHKQL